MDQKEKVKLILERLYKLYPHPKTALNFTNPLELLVATILSAQATDKSVNLATPTLFKKFTVAKDYAKASPEEIDQLIKNINFHFNKAKTLIKMGQALEEKFKGVVPQTMKELDSLPGVARKTANCVMGDAFGITSGIVVDTHVIRLSNKLGLTDKKDPVKIEQDLMKIVPKENWIDFSHLLINHGRDICTARPHSCQNCPLGDLCPDMK